MGGSYLPPLVFFLGLLHHPWVLFRSTRHTGGEARTEDGGGHLAASSWVSLAFASGVGGVAAPSCVSLRFANGVDPARTAVVVSPPRRGVFLGSANSGRPAKAAVVLTPPRCVVSLAFANRVCPARTAVVLAPPLLAYGCCGWACSRVCRQRRQRWGSRCVAFASRDGPGIRGG